MMVIGLALTTVAVVLLLTGGNPTAEAAAPSTSMGSVETTTAVTKATTTSTSTTTTSSTTSTTTTTTVPAETPEEFLTLLVQGLRGDPEFLVSRLNQATIDIYGAEQCLETFRTVLDPDTTLEITGMSGPKPWDYEIDGIVTPQKNVLFVEVERFVAGETRTQELHWQLVDGLWTWYSDCGDPIEAGQ